MPPKPEKQPPMLRHTISSALAYIGMPMLNEKMSIALYIPIYTPGYIKFILEVIEKVSHSRNALSNFIYQIYETVRILSKTLPFQDIQVPTTNLPLILAR